MMIKRDEILRECRAAKGSLDQVIAQRLAGVRKEIIEDDKVIDFNRALMLKERNDLLNGGFGSSQSEGTEEAKDQDMARAFFLGNQGKKNYIIHMSASILADREYLGEVFAIGREETASYYGMNKNEKLEEKPGDGLSNSVGVIVSNDNYAKLLNTEVEIEGYDFFGTCLHGEWLFYRTNPERSFMTLLPFDLVTNLYSRNTGLLESEIMLKKKVVIAGAGSVGSFIALELARAGVGHFVLCDSDILEIHNICRHQLGWRDVGRYKVDAVRDAILNINPAADVQVFHGFLQDMPEEYGEETDMVIGTGDNREANAFANELAEALNVPFVNTGCWQRAHAGEVFYWYPGGGMPLYRKAFASLISDERAASHANYFADEGDENHLNFEPGVSSDIEFVTLVAVKVIYDLLNKGEDGYTLRVLDYLKPYTLICNTNKACIGGENAEMFPNPLFISSNITLEGQG